MEDLIIYWDIAQNVADNDSLTVKECYFDEQGSLLDEKRPVPPYLKDKLDWVIEYETLTYARTDSDYYKYRYSILNNKGEVVLSGESSMSLMCDNPNIIFNLESGKMTTS